MACGILVPGPGIEPAPPALEAWSPNHWTTREVPADQSTLNESKMLFIKRSLPYPVRFSCWTERNILMNASFNVNIIIVYSKVIRAVGKNYFYC